MTVTQLATFAPDGSQPRWLGQYGTYSPPVYSFSTPGGCNQLTTTFAKPARYRTDALNPGRLVNAYRGGTLAWSGILDEPVPTDVGWDLTAHGAGGFGDDWRVLYSGAWGSGTFNTAVDGAIGRGLDWVRVTDIGAVSGLWVGQAIDSGSDTITDLLNMGCHKGGLTWSVVTGAQGNLLYVYALPTAPNRILISTQPEARSIASGPNALYVRRQATWDNGNVAATFATSIATNAPDITAHGRKEDFVDISSNGVYSDAQAIALAQTALKRFQRAGWSDPFTVQPGQLTTQGGQRCDLGLFWADGITAMVCELWLADFGYGGEVSGGPTSFLVGGYEYDGTTGQATIQPFETARHDFATLMSIVTDTAPIRTKPVHKHRHIFHPHAHIPRRR